ncbi:hypothetical protein Q427_34035 [Halomonas sp. BC04]|nr:hypothetical protein Q427_34035 [Halomonas sp. BC04]
MTKDGHVTEAGAQLLNQDMENLIGLVREAGLELVTTAAGSAAVAIDAAGSVDAAPWLTQWEEEWPRLLALAGVQAGLPDQSLAQLIRQVATDPKGIRIMESSLGEFLCREPSVISAQGLLELYARYPSERSDGELQVSGPLGSVVNRLTAELHTPPRYNAPVNEVAEEGGDLLVRTPQGDYRAQRVILAVTPVAARDIKLPAAVHAKLMRRSTAMMPAPW